MSRYIAAYDIGHPSQRTKVAAVLNEYGVRLQFSVFEVDLEPEEISHLQRRLGLPTRGLWIPPVPPVCRKGLRYATLWPYRDRDV